MVQWQMTRQRAAVIAGIRRVRQSISGSSCLCSWQQLPVLLAAAVHTRPQHAHHSAHQELTSWSRHPELLLPPCAAESSEDSRQYMMFKNLRDAMFTRGLRPNRYTHMHVCRGYIRMRDADLALAAFTSMREASGAGGSRLLERQYLASLLSEWRAAACCCLLLPGPVSSDIAWLAWRGSALPAC